MMTSGALLLLALSPVGAFVASAMIFSGLKLLNDRLH